MKPACSLAQLLSRLPKAQSKLDTSVLEAVTVSGISHDSRLVESGDVFVCLRGQAFDGHRYALDALQKGAAALVVQAGGLEETGIDLPRTRLLLR